MSDSTMKILSESTEMVFKFEYGRPGSNRDKSEAFEYLDNRFGAMEYGIRNIETESSGIGRWTSIIRIVIKP